MSDWKFGAVLQDPSDGEMVMLIAKDDHGEDTWCVIGIPADDKAWWTPSNKVTHDFISEPTDWELVDD